MTDRSSSQGLPDDWGPGGHAARELYYGAEPTEAHGIGTAGFHRAGTADPYRTEAARADETGSTSPFGTATASPFGTATAGPFGTATANPYGAGNADPFGTATADPYGAGTADPYGAGNGDPFAARRGDPFGPRNTDPFGAETTNAYGAGAETGTARPDAKPPMATIRLAAPGEAADSKGFLGALFDFGFTSFVTPKVIKALYVLIMIGTVISALVFTVLAFRVSTAFGILTLIIGDPLFIVIVLAIYRIILEFFMAMFRVAEDVQALRERGDAG
jgi:Domain of unknown function (DUF4282)